MKKLIIILLLSLGFIGAASAGEVETNTLKLKALNSCEGCNLQGGDLFGVNLSGVNLKNANIDGATLCNTKTPWGIDDSGC